MDTGIMSLERFCSVEKGFSGLFPRSMGNSCEDYRRRRPRSSADLPCPIVKESPSTMSPIHPLRTYAYNLLYSKDQRRLAIFRVSNSWLPHTEIEMWRTALVLSMSEEGKQLYLRRMRIGFFVREAYPCVASLVWILARLIVLVLS